MKQPPRVSDNAVQLDQSAASGAEVYSAGRGCRLTAHASRFGVLYSRDDLQGPVFKAPCESMLAAHGPCIQHRPLQAMLKGGMQLADVVKQCCEAGGHCHRLTSLPRRGRSCA